MDTQFAQFEAIKKSVRQALREEDSLKIAPYIPHAKESQVPSSPVIYSDELRYLNHHWGNWSSLSDFNSHRPLLGRLIIPIKKKLQRFIFETCARSTMKKKELS
jgi:hypothetical protein